MKLGIKMPRLLTSITCAILYTTVAVSPVVAKDKQARTFVVVNEAVGVPVFPHDFTDRQYNVLGEVKAEVRKATIFSKEASQEKIYLELWERGDKLGADAVINVKYGDSRVTLMSWGSTAVTGTAIKFVAVPPAPVAPTEAVATVTASPEAGDAPVVNEPAPASASNPQ